ncbi:MAG: bifunctional ornithine acetyltransferase/N-acetylglutamate synthase [Pseudomonadales bacterium]
MINTGCANAGTGKQGIQDAQRSCAAFSKITGVAAENILPFSTGVIGELLPMDKLEAGLTPALENLASEHWLRAAEGIAAGYASQNCVEKITYSAAKR